MEMKFYAQLQKSADSGGHEYLPKNMPNFMEKGRVSIFSDFIFPCIIFFYQIFRLQNDFLHLEHILFKEESRNAFHRSEKSIFLVC